MRVLWFAQYPLAPGKHPAPWVTSLEKGLRKADMDLEIVVSDWKQDRIVRRRIINGTSIISVKIMHPVIDILTFRLLSFIRILFFTYSALHRADVVHVHGLEREYALVVPLFRRKTVVSVQGFLSAYLWKRSQSSFVYWFWVSNLFNEWLGLFCGKYFFTRTHWDRDRVEQASYMGLLPRRQFRIWEVLRKEFFASHNSSSSKKLLFIGGGQLIKGVLFALRILEFLVKKDPEYQLEICGLKGDFNVTAYLRRKPELQNHVTISGMKSAKELTELFGQCLCLLHPSKLDNSPNSVCEAQASGLPVFAYDVGGVASLMSHGKNGFLYPYGSVNRIATDILKLQGDIGLYSAISSAGMKLAAERHNEVEIINQTIRAYKMIAK